MSLKDRTRYKEQELTPRQKFNSVVSFISALGVVTAAFASTANNLEAKGVPLKDWGADYAHSKFDQTKTEEAMELALQQALGKKIVVRCAQISKAQKTDLNDDQDPIVYPYPPVTSHPIIRIDQDACDQTVQILRSDETSNDNEDATIERTAKVLSEITRIGIWLTTKEQNPAVLDCHTMQKTAYVAKGIGASDIRAYEIGAKIVSTYTNAYGQIDGCYLNGPLDTTNGQSPFLALGPNK